MYLVQDITGGGNIITRNISEAGSYSLLSIIDEHSSVTQSALTVRTDSSTATTPAIEAQRNGIAATSTDGILITNTTAALVGAQVQQSPRIRLHSAAWRINATAATQTHDWIIENVPAAHATTTTSTFKFGHSQNGAAYTFPMTLTNAGALTTTTVNTKSFTVDREAVTASTTTDAQSYYFGCDTVGADTVTLQTADCVSGRIIVVADENGNAAAMNITIDTQGAEEIDGQATATISENYGSITMMASGSHWKII